MLNKLSVAAAVALSMPGVANIASPNVRRILSEQLSERKRAAIVNKPHQGARERARRLRQIDKQKGE